MKQAITTMLMVLVTMATMVFAGCSKDDNNSGSSSDNANVEWVDLGLPSGLLWATRNMGATTTEGYGDYFAWGEITPKDVNNWSPYVYLSNDNKLTKYCNNSEYGVNCFTDTLTILEPCDDVATVSLGNGARMPTADEWLELVNNTTVEWATLNGIAGCRFIAKNGNTIFLPAAGYRLGSEIYGAGGYGNYWSASLYTDDPHCAWLFYMDANAQRISYTYRADVLPVRAVRDRQN